VSGRVLLTGAGGLLGRPAALALAARGFEVVAVSRHGPVAADLLDAGARRTLMAHYRPSHWLHLAWETKHGYFWSAPENEDWVEASLDLARHFADGGGQRAVIAGSCAEYDWSALPRTPISEAAPLAPATAYGAAKCTLHARLARLARGAFDYGWGRVFLPVGEGEHPDRLVPSILRALLAGEPAAVTSGRQVRDFIDARDAGAAFAALLASDVTGPVNIGSGDGHSVAELATTLGRLAGRPELVRLGALPDRLDDPPYLVAKVDRLTQEVGFRPAIDFETMLADARAHARHR
jgi:nucleoside-diphosphate-sugar epimerase